jgi:hypothetical protein
MPSPFKVFLRAVLCWLMLAGIGGGISGASGAHAATLVWDANTETNLAGYIVYYSGGANEGSTNVLLNTQWPLAGLPRGFTYQLYVTAYNTDGIESDPSDTVEYDAPHLPPRILAQPTNLLIASGTSIPLTVQAVGTGGLHYQWFKDGFRIAGATTPDYVIENASPSDTGTYALVVTNPGGANRASFDVQVRPGVSAPVIFSEPASLTAIEGRAAQLQVQSLNSDSGIRYQWWKDGAEIPGATNSTLRLPNAQASDAGRYYAILANAAGSLPSETGVISVVGPAKIETGPLGREVVQGSDLILTATASGTEPISYQWFWNGQELSGETNSTLSISGVTTENAGNYSVRVSNGFGTAASDPAPVNVLVPPQIVEQSDSINIALGKTLTLSVSATGTAPLQYQWYKDGQALPDKTNSSFTIGSTAYTDSASYYVIISNTAGEVASSDMAIAVGAPQIAPIPAAEIKEGESLWLNFAVEGDQPMTYQWFKNGELLPGQINPSVTITSATVADEGLYSLQVSNSRGSASEEVQLTVATPPRFLSDPQSISIGAGSEAVFSVAVHGTGLSYQWLKDGTPIPNATNSILSIADVRGANAGIYSVFVTNSLGSATSAGAELTIIPIPIITSQPVGRFILAGSPLTLSVTEESDLLVNFQWWKDGEILSNATSSFLVLTNAAEEDSGSYFVIVENSFGTATSDITDVIVVPPLQIVTQPKSQTVIEGFPLKLSVGVSGSGAIQYTWFKDGIVIPNATNALLSIPSATFGDAGKYNAVVSDPVSTATSNPAVIKVQEPLPDELAGRIVIETLPSGKVVIEASGIPGETYDVEASQSLDSGDWVIIATEVVDATGTFQIDAPSAPDGGFWVIRTVRRPASNSAG